MDTKDFQLYAQENKQILLETQTILRDLKTLLDVKLPQQINTPDNIHVTGDVKILNQQDAIELSNIALIKTWVTEQTEAINKTIKDNHTKEVTDVTVKNIADAQAKTVNVTNIKEFATNLVKELAPIVAAIKEIKPVVTTQKVELSTDPTKPIAVRLSDGKSFYKAIAAAMSGGGVPTLNGFVPVVNPDGTYTGNVLGVPKHNNGTVTYPNATTDVFTFKTNATTVGTVTITYTDSTKASMSTWSIA